MYAKNTFFYPVCLAVPGHPGEFVLLFRVGTAPALYKLQKSGEWNIPHLRYTPAYDK